MNTKNLGYICFDKADLDDPELRSGCEGNTTDQRSVAAEPRVCDV